MLRLLPVARMKVTLKPVNDMRDLIIRRQALYIRRLELYIRRLELYIRRLELKVDDLKMQLSQQSLSNDAMSCAG